MLSEIKQILNDVKLHNVNRSQQQIDNSMIAGGGGGGGGDVSGLLSSPQKSMAPSVLISPMLLLTKDDVSPMLINE